GVRYCREDRGQAFRTTASPPYKFPRPIEPAIAAHVWCDQEASRDHCRFPQGHCFGTCKATGAGLRRSSERPRRSTGGHSRIVKFARGSPPRCPSLDSQSRVLHSLSPSHRPVLQADTPPSCRGPDCIDAQDPNVCFAEIEPHPFWYRPAIQGAFAFCPRPDSAVDQPLRDGRRRPQA
ncbi:hypothetical protein BGX23_005998, partial [Mortierella sp. AD031]